MISHQSMTSHQLARYLLKSPDLPIIGQEREGITIKRIEIIDSKHPAYVKWSESNYDYFEEWSKNQPKMTVLEIS